MGAIRVHDGSARATAAPAAAPRRAGRPLRLGLRHALQLLALCAGVAIGAVFDYAPMDYPARMTCEEFLGLTPSQRAGVVASIEGATAIAAARHSAATARHAAGLARQCRHDGDRRLGDLQPDRSDAATTLPYTTD